MPTTKKGDSVIMNKQKDQTYIVRLLWNKKWIAVPWEKYELQYKTTKRCGAEYSDV